MDAGAASVKIVTLLNKGARRRNAMEPDYKGFECDDKFVVGYGLDFDSLYRGLPYIGVLKPEMYS
jgi:hypoxanthine phosphoribosyltransferase